MMSEYGKLSDYKNMETHYYICKTCGGKSLDSDTQALAGLETLTPENVMHDRFCPGKAFPDKYVRRVQHTY